MVKTVLVPVTTVAVVAPVAATTAIDIVAEVQTVLLETQAILVAPAAQVV